MPRSRAAARTRAANAASRAPMPRLQQTTRVGRAVPRERLADAALGLGPALEVPERAVVLELAHVVDEEELGGGHRVGAEVEVEVDRKAERAVGEPVGRERGIRLLHDRPGGDHDVGLLDGLTRARRLLDPVSQRPDALGVRVPGPDGDLGVQLPQHLGVEPSLLSRSEHGCPAPVLRREPADADAARRSGARRGDLGSVHDRRRHARLRVVQDDEPRDVGEAALLVRRVAGHPLERRDVVVAQVRRHRVDEGVGPRMDPRLRRELDAPRADRPVRLLDEVELVGDAAEGGPRLLAASGRAGSHLVDANGLDARP